MIEESKSKQNEELKNEKKLDKNDIMKRDIEAILLLSGDDLKIDELMKYFKKSETVIREVLFLIKENFKTTGINLHIKGERVYLATNSMSGENIHNFFNQEGRPKKLTAAAIETLSIIAYRQPVTKSEIEDVRGVAVDGVMQTLEEKKLVYLCGKKESTGRPNLYGTTDNFLAYMGIDSMDELPNYREVREEIDRKNEDK